MSVTYGISKTVACPFDEALARVTRALGSEGFGVLSDIDVANTFQQKLGESIPPYRILGACNPTLARRAVLAEPEIGLLLPCNVVVRQDDAGAVHVDVIEPVVMFRLVDQPELEELAKDVGERLRRALDAV